jgi:hypothetical protein
LITVKTQHKPRLEPCAPATTCDSAGGICTEKVGAKSDVRLGVSFGQHCGLVR